MSYQDPEDGSDDAGNCVMNCASASEDFTLTFELSPCLGTGCLRCRRNIGCIACDDGYYLDQDTGLCKSAMLMPAFTESGSNSSDNYAFNEDANLSIGWGYDGVSTSIPLGAFFSFPIPILPAGVTTFKSCLLTLSCSLY